jgi:hypothetical protein
VGRSILVEADRVGPTEHRIKSISGRGFNLAGLFERGEMIGLDVEEAGFHCRSPAQAPQ